MEAVASALIDTCMLWKHTMEVASHHVVWTDSFTTQLKYFFAPDAKNSPCSSGMSTGSPDNQRIFFMNQPVLSSWGLTSVVYVYFQLLFVCSYYTSVGVSMRIFEWIILIFKTVDGSFIIFSLSFTLFMAHDKVGILFSIVYSFFLVCTFIFYWCLFD